MLLRDWPFFSFAFPRLGQQEKVGDFESPSCGGGFIVEGRDKPPPAALFCSERGEQRGQHPSVSAPALLGSCSLSSPQGKMSSLHDTGSSQQVWPRLVMCWFVCSREIHINHWVNTAIEKEIHGLRVIQIYKCFLTSVCLSALTQETLWI